MDPNIGSSSSTPGRMSLRSSCNGDCERIKGGGVGKHHHHHTHGKVTSAAKSRQSAVQLTNSARSSVASRQSSSKSKVTAQSTTSVSRSNFSVTVTSATPNTSNSLLKGSLRDSVDQSPKVVSQSSQTLVTERDQRFLNTSDSSFRTPSMPWLQLSNSDQTSLALDRSQKKTSSSSTTTTHSVHRRRKQYSDYSSGEEYDIDSSYSSRESASREVPSPNMSRKGLHGISGTSTPYISSTTQKYGSSARASSSALGVSAIMVSSTPGVAADSLLDGTESYSGQQYSTNSARVSYGLDYESDTDDVQQVPQQYYQRYGVHTVTTTSTVTEIFRYAAAPFKKVYNTAWSYLYWLISSVLVLDTWILSRQILKSWWFLLPLFLLPLLVLVGQLVQEDAVSPISSLISSVTLPTLPVLPFFAIFGNNSSGNAYTTPSASSPPPVIVPSATSSCSDNSANQLAIDNLKEMILNIHQTQKDQLNRAQVEDVVRSVVNQEMLKFTSAATDNQADVKIQAKSLSEHSSQLADLQSQMQLILSQSQTLADELKNTKEKILEERRSNHKDSLTRLEGLEMDLDSLKDNIHHVQQTQNMLLANMRNCCRNNTYDPVLVENQVAAILMQVMGKSPPSGRGRSEVVGFTDWLKASFVGQSDLDSRLSSSAAEMSHVLTQDVSAKAETAAKLAAAAAVKASLSEHRFSANLSQNKSVALSEDDIRKIVRDALTIYDADKTGQPDFALESAGGSVISTRCSETYHSRTGQVTVLGIPLWFTYSTPRVAIQPGVQPGECWAFKGSEGYLVIQLSGWVQPTAFSIEHISRALVPNQNLDSAPKEFSVYGLKHDKDIDSTLIGRYTYTVDGEPLQYFAVADPDIEAFPIVELRIHSNHGNLEYTCLYRFRVHGKLLKHS